MLIQVNSTVPLFFLALEKDCPVEILQNLLNAMQSSDLEERDEVISISRLQ